MKILVDSKLCIGCGLCADVASDIFEMKDGISVVKSDSPVSDSSKQEAEMAKDCCPVQAISILEEA